ncbi:RNA-binding protein NOB1 [Phalaenopsis equestris]|uniref:RNA-binding protein NOB1 n=1 Tax=Phalaenopsis equestris TaxID=78828 RepID=UPI0009E601AB|nr:RNA-binding protein NOB1 [Phalaenopsis equestris]
MEPPPPPSAPSDACPPQSAPASCWSTIVQKKPPPASPLPSNVFGDCKSSKGISVAVVDASAIIHGDKLSGYADKFVSVREVVEEVRDPVSRQRLAHLPFFVETMEPSADALKKIVKFARETGDLHTLSDVDLKLIALTYMLEAQIHGTNHLRDSPPLLHVVNVKNLPEAKMPGWGDNVPNLAEWEALEQVSEGGLMGDSRILPLKDLDDNIIKATEASSKPTEQQNEHQTVLRSRKYNFPKREIKIAGKKMVADGVDASNGEDINNVDDWHPAVSRSTHMKYLKRKARRESRLEAMVNEHPVGEDEPSKKDELQNSKSMGNIICSDFEQMSLGTDNSEVPQEEENVPSLIDEDSLDNVENENDICENVSENLEVSSNGDSGMNTSLFDDVSSEQSWMMRSLSDSTVACITSDYAMQNVILQIGLRLLAPGGMQIRQLHRWVLKCHACNNVTREIGKIFCPKCGNGGTLRKVSVTVGENGVLLASRRQRFILRGTKYSLPLPQGGRHAITKNLILREDQLPHKLLYPKMKNKPNNKNEDFLCSDDIFSNVSEKRAPLKPPVRKALALFTGKRNPNDNHFSRKH